MEPQPCNDGYYRYLYKIINKETGQYYIGIHKTRRLNDGYMGSGVRIKKDIKLLGATSFQKNILEYFSTDADMLKRESEIICTDMLNDPLCYNIIPGGGGYQFKNLFPAYNPQTNEIRALNNDDELIKNGTFVHITTGRISITNGAVVKFIFPSELESYLADGWKRGGLPRSVKIKINNTQIVKVINPSELESYLADGWKRGGLPNSCRGKIRVIKDGVEKMVFPSELESYLADGWKRGSLHKLRIHIIKDGVEKMVFPSELESYLADGWKRGSLSHSIKGRYKIYKDNLKKTCNPSELESYLADGWKRGNPPTTAGRVTINDGLKVKRVQPSELESYLADGWKRGGLPSKILL